MTKSIFEIQGKFDNGLDVGCGTGSSTTALRKICTNVVGVDEAEIMLDMAKKVNGGDMNISYKQCRAEELNFAEDSFDIIPYGFEIYKQEKYNNAVSMTQQDFIRFKLTQSNVIAQVEQQGQSLNEVQRWFEEKLEHIFEGRAQTLVFEGYN